MAYSVLIVDDEPLVCMGLLELVDWEGFGFDKTDVRFSYVEGLRAALSFPYTLIIADIRIHDSNGLELVRIVKEREMCAHFIMISAHSEFEYAHTALKYGVRCYLLKPLNRSEVLSSIGQLVATLPPPDTTGPAEGRPPEAESPASAPSTRDSERKRVKDIDTILAYIHRHYDDSDISLTGFANSMYMNPSYLGQLFRKQTGIKFTDYLNQYRIVKACELLLEGKKLTYEICELVGFGSIAYFHRIFKKVTGYGTDEYRKKAARGLVNIPSLPGTSHN